jgi:transcription initiation factor IIF auxiliary subunit
MKIVQDTRVMRTFITSVAEETSTQVPATHSETKAIKVSATEKELQQTIIQKIISHTLSQHLGEKIKGNQIKTPY